METWIKLTKARKQEIFRQASNNLGLTAESIEKDFWVVVMLRALFSLPISDQLVFKGGTSLSKCWDFLQRFSEDIDIAMNRELIGYGGDLSKSRVNKMRKDACTYISTTLKDMLQERLIEMGFSQTELSIEAEATENHKAYRDPQKLFIYYESITAQSGYLRDRVVVEVGSRSQLEPSERKQINSMVAEAFPESDFIQQPLELTAVLPSRTFWEKIILLHEELRKPFEHIRHERMSRHLYDIERLMDTAYGHSALEDQGLFDAIVQHRSLFTPVKGVDYATLSKQQLDFIPSGNVLASWEADYKIMREVMFYGNSLGFQPLLARLNELSARIKRQAP